MTTFDGKDAEDMEKRKDHDRQESLQTDTKAEKSSSAREKEKKKLQKPDGSKVGERAARQPIPRSTTKVIEKPNAPVSTKSKQKKTTSPSPSSGAKGPQAKQKMRSVNGGPSQLPCPSKDSEREVEIRLLQVECDELRGRLGCLKEGLVGQKPSDVEQLLKQSQKELLWLQRQLSFISSGGPACILSPNKFRNDLQCLQPSVHHRTYNQIHFLEEKSRPFRSDVTAISPGKVHWTFLDDEFKDAVQDESRLSLQYASLSHRPLQYDQVKSDYEQLRETLTIVTKERDLAVKEKYQLQAKLENLEQVLKHMREAAERRQQLELEHEQALAVLTAKQQEIEFLQKAQVEAKKEHEGAVQLLENTLDSMQAKVRELEEKCRTQSEQFHLLSRELEKFRQQAGNIDLLSGNVVASDVPGYPIKTLTQLINGIATSIGKGHEIPASSRLVISEFIRPLQIAGDKPGQLSVRPTFLTRTRSSSPGNRLESDMDNEQKTNTSKRRYSGKVHLCIARYSYNPFDGPNENPEAELPLVAGKYLYVYGDMDEDGFYEGELLDGQRGLVPSNFVDFVQNDESHVSSTLASEQEENFLNHSAPLLQGGHKLEITPPIHIEPIVLNNGTGTMDVNIDEIGEDIVPYPRKITLIKQLAKSVIVGWEPPLVPPGWGTIHSYNVLVGKDVRATLSFGSRTKSLIEKLDLDTVTYRISIQTVTNRGNSDELQCTLLVGKDVIVAPSHLKVDNITQLSADLSWLPSNSNYSHVIFLSDEEFDMVKAATYKYHFFNLKPNVTYKLKLLAQPHQMPWQLPLEQRERKEACVEFSTQPSGPPIPPEEVAVHPGPTPVTLLVTWKPPVLTPTGTSNGASVTGFSVYAKGQKVAEVVFPAAENIVVDLLKILNLDANEVTVRTLSAQGESQDSSTALIPPNLLVPPTHHHPRTMPRCKPLTSAGVPDTKDEHVCPHRKVDESWEQTRSASPPVHGHTLEPPMSNFHSPNHGQRSPSPQRILPQPQGAPISNTMAKAMAREAAQRVAESNRNEKRSLFSERSTAVQYANSDDEDDYDSPHIKRKGASVDEFLKGSELGKQPHYCPDDEYHTESSRGSDLSDILEEDEEELYSEMQLEDGGRRRVSVTSHNTLKSSKTCTTEAALKHQPDPSPPHHPSKNLSRIPEVAEEGEPSEVSHKGGSVGMPCKTRGTIARTNRMPRASSQDGRHQSPWHFPKSRWSGASLNSDDFSLEEKGSKLGSLSRSPDSGLDCGSEDEESRFHFRNAHNTIARNAAPSSPEQRQNCACPWDRQQMLTRRKTLTRQCSVEEDFGDVSADLTDNIKHSKHKAGRHDLQQCIKNVQNDDWVGWKTDLYQKDCKKAALNPTHRDTENSLLLGSHSTLGRTDRGDHTARRMSRGNTVPQRPRPMMVPSIEITMDSNSEGGRSRSGSEGNISPVKEEAYYRSIGEHRKWSLQRARASDDRYDSYGSREQLSSEMYEESETDGGMEDFPVRIFVALFDYDPRTMSPNPDAAEEELPFKEGQIIKVYGDKDSDGFYRGETCGRAGYIPCNMVSEIQADDEEMMDELLKQGFLSLNTPVEKIVNCDRFKESSRSVHRRSRKSKRERNRRSGRQHSVCTRRMVALYDYDPRESSPNVDVETELTFCTGDIITVLGEIDEDGFYYGELNGHKGLVPSNFLEEVPDDVEVYLSDVPSRYSQDTPVRTKAKRVPPENASTPRRTASPTVNLHSVSPPMGSGSPMRGRERSAKKKKGLLSKGKKLLKKLGAVK